MATCTTKSTSHCLPRSTENDDAGEGTLRTLSATSRCRITWTPGLILRRILERQRAGLSLGAVAVRRDSVNLLSAARRYFGSWPAALIAAGIESSKGTPSSRYTQESVIARLREQAAAGLPLSTKHPLLRTYAKPAIRLFGSWMAALKAAGVEPAKHNRSIAKVEAGGGRPHPITENDVLKVIAKALDEGRIPHLRDSDLRPYVSAAYRYYGSWPEAVKRARELCREETLRASPNAHAAIVKR